MKKNSPWRNYTPSQIKKNVLKFWEYKKQRRDSEAMHILKIYSYAAFHIQPIGLIIFYLFMFGFFSFKIANIFKQPITESHNPGLELITYSSANWNSIKISTLNRTSITNFRKAKRKLYPIYERLGLQKTFYCDCEYSGKKPDLSSCGVVPKKNVKRMGRTEVEHVGAISWHGKQLDCWKSGGRKNCSRNDNAFKKAEADIHNLVPALGEVNGNRSNYHFVDDIPGEVRKYGACDFEIAHRQAEPPSDKRGEIARAILYMDNVYGMNLTESQKAMYLRWHQNDLPTENEIRIHAAKAKAQGNVNPYVSLN
jgi:deoxyribonuclease-1